MQRNNNGNLKTLSQNHSIAAFDVKTTFLNINVAEKRN